MVISRASADRGLIMLLVLVACLGQPNALHLVIPNLSVLLAATLIGVLGYLLVSSEFRIGDHVACLEVNAPLLLYFGLAACSLLYAEQPEFGAALLVSALLKVLMFYLLLIAAGRHSLSVVVAGSVVAASTLFSLSGVMLFVAIAFFGVEPIAEIGITDVGGGLQYDQLLRFYGLGFVRSQTSLLDLVFPRLQSYFAEPGYFGFFLELAIFCTLYLRHQARPGTRRWVNVALAIQFIALALTLSLGAVFAILGGFVVYAMVTGNIRRLGLAVIKAGTAVVLAIAVIAAWLRVDLTFGAIFQIFVTERFETAHGDSSADTRLAMFKLGVELVEERPMIGWGFGQVRVALNGMGVNNAFLTAFAELGIGGFIAYAAIVLAVSGVAMRTVALGRQLSAEMRGESAAVVAMFTATTLHSLLLDSSWTFIYWISIAMVFLHRIKVVWAVRDARVVAG